MIAAQILSVIIFIVMFILIVMDKIERHYVTLGCAALTLIGVFGLVMRNFDAILRTLNVKSIFTLSFWYESGMAEESTSGINCSTKYLR